MSQNQNRYFSPHEALSKVGSDTRPKSAWRTLTWGLDHVADPPMTGHDEDVAEWFRSLCRDYHRRSSINGPYQGFVENAPAAVHGFPLLRKAFGGHIKMLTIVRDGRAVYNSWRQTDFGPATAPMAAHRWARDSLLSARLAEQHPQDVACVRYEDLVLSGYPYLEDVLERLGVGILGTTSGGDEPNVGLRIDGYTQRDHSLVSRSPQPARVSGWRNELPEREQVRFTRNAYAILDTFGYDVESQRAEIRPSPVATIASQLVEPILQLAKTARRAARQALRRVKAPHLWN